MIPLTTFLYTFPRGCSVPYVLLGSGLFNVESVLRYVTTTTLYRDLWCVQTAGEPRLAPKMPGCLFQFFAVRTLLENSKCPRALVIQLGEFDVIYSLLNVVCNIDALSWRRLHIIIN